MYYYQPNQSQRTSVEFDCPVCGTITLLTGTLHPAEPRSWYYPGVPTHIEYDSLAPGCGTCGYELTADDEYYLLEGVVDDIESYREDDRYLD